MLLPRLVVLAALFGGAVALSHAADPVVVADADSFEAEVLSLAKPTFVAFTAPWCPHCVELKDEYHEAARQLDGIVKFVSVDCDARENVPLCVQYQVQGFPTLKMFPPTQRRLPKLYLGGRTTDALVEYAVSELPAKNVLKLPASQIKSFVSNDQAKVLLLTSKPASSPLYRSLALDFKGRLTLASARVSQADVQAALQEVHLDPAPKLVYIPPSNPVYEKYEGPMEFYPLRAWLEERAPAPALEKGDPSSKLKKKIPKSRSPVPDGGANEGRPVNDYRDGGGKGRYEKKEKSFLPPSSEHIDEEELLRRLQAGAEGETLSSIFAEALKGSTGEFSGAKRVLAALAGASAADARMSSTTEGMSQDEQRGMDESIRAVQDAVKATLSDSMEDLDAKIQQSIDWLMDAIALDKHMGSEHKILDDTQRRLLDKAEKILRRRLEQKKAGKLQRAGHEDL